MSGARFIVVWMCILLPLDAALGDVKDAMVKVYTTYNRPNYHEPWQMLGQRTFHGSGSIIDGERILTNAHVVSDQTFIQVRRAGRARKYTARVALVAHECDLAVLKVDDPLFFKGVTPLEIGELARLRDKVSVFGFPEGGDKLSITEGVVSRVEHRSYAHGNAFLLACQIDASISSGSSGGSVVKEGKIVGVAFQGLFGARYENIGYMVPAPVIAHFLKDIEDGDNDGVPGLGISMQKMENPDMRRAFSMSEADSGVLVNRIYPDSPGNGILEENDVILSIDGVNVENDGTVEFRKGERTYFGYITQRKFIGDAVQFDILRAGRRHRVDIRLAEPVNSGRLVPHARYDVAPTYFIEGGLVFEPLTSNYLAEFGGPGDWFLRAPKEMMYYYHHGEPTRDRRQIVILVKTLADAINVGYHGFENWVVDMVNGKKISTIHDLASALENHDGEFHVIENPQGFKIILDRVKTEENSGKILKRYKIPSDRSDDLKRKEKR